MSTVTIHESNATINVGSNASFLVTGDDNTFLVGQDSTLTARGAALLIEISGPGDVVTIGANGQAASDGDDNIVLFQAAGALLELPQSRVDANADNSYFTMNYEDNLGVYGAGDTVYENGLYDGLWIGQNGVGATGAQRDFVSGVYDSTLYVMQGSSVVASGADFTASMNGDDRLTATGLGVVVNVTGSNNVLTIGGDGADAVNGFDDVVLMQGAGTVYELANSRVDVNAYYSSAVLAGDDVFGIYGRGDVVVANGSGDSLWVGQNGRNATGADVDHVHGLVSGRLYEMQGSRLTLDGSDDSVTMSGDDALTATGVNLLITAQGSGNTLALGGQGVATFQAPGSVYVLPASEALVIGDDLTVTLAASLLGGSNLGLTGFGDRVTAAGFGQHIDIGPVGAGEPRDSVTFTGAQASSAVTLLQHSNAAITGNGVNVTLNGDDIVWLSGANVTVSDDGAPLGGDHISIGGDAGAASPSAAEVDLVNAGDSVAVRNNTKAIVNNLGLIANGDVRLALGANDWVYVSNRIDIFVPVAAGSDRIDYFSIYDTLHLATHFASVSALLNATSEINGAAVIALDASGDTLTLAGVSKSEVASLAQQGIIKFA